MREIGVRRRRSAGVDLAPNTNQGVGTQMQDAGNPSIVSLHPAPWSLHMQFVES